MRDPEDDRPLCRWDHAEGPGWDLDAAVQHVVKRPPLGWEAPIAAVLSHPPPHDAGSGHSRLWAAAQVAPAEVVAAASATLAYCHRLDAVARLIEARYLDVPFMEDILQHPLPLAPKKATPIPPFKPVRRLPVRPRSARPIRAAPRRSARLCARPQP